MQKQVEENQPPKRMIVEVPVELFFKTIEYLSKRPWGEVDPLLAAFKPLPVIDGDRKV